MLVTEADSSMSTTLYRKDTHTDQYLHFSVANPWNINWEVVKMPLKKVDNTVSDKTEKTKEQDLYQGYS